MVEKKKTTKATKKKTAKRKKPAKKKVEIRKEEVPIVEAAVEAKVEVKPVEEVAVRPEPVVEKPKREKLPKGLKYYGTGRRKEAVAKVWLKPGAGEFMVNGKGASEYFCNRKLLEFQINRPFVATNTQGKYDVFVEAFGGGVPGQAGAVVLGISRALLEVSPDFRVKLKREGLLRRDPRMKERKKYGLKRARRAFQYTKR